MKTAITHWTFWAFILSLPILAQNKTNVTANSSDISDNLDLRAVATIFGDSKNLEDFEQRLNDPKSQISNLDLNNDNYVDYLRVIETIEGNAHIVVLQAVLGQDKYQDVATIEIERDRNNRVQVQVVGDVYMYGSNYIYEPVYVHVPVIYNTFWVNHYRPYCSVWTWNYYPSYYYYWNPFPIFRYRNHIHLHINFGHNYHYVTQRRCHNAYYAYYGRRGNYYENTYPNRSFSHRNSGFTNRYEMDSQRTIKTRVPGSNELAANEPRNSQPREVSNVNQPRHNENIMPKGENSIPKPRMEYPRQDINTIPKVESNISQPRVVQPKDNSNNIPRNENSIPKPRIEYPRHDESITSRGDSHISQPRFEAPKNQRSRYEFKSNHQGQGMNNGLRGRQFESTREVRR